MAELWIFLSLAIKQLDLQIPHTQHQVKYSYMFVLIV